MFNEYMFQTYMWEDYMWPDIVMPAESDGTYKNLLLLGVG